MGTSNLHVYLARDQPATRAKYVLDMPEGPKAFWIKHPAHRPLPCFKCRKRRWAANMIAHVYYDGTYYFCREGKGCKIKKKRRGRRERLR